MSFSREYAHRPPIPTAEEILQDFDSTMKNKEFKDPVFVSHEDIFQEGKREHKTDDKDMNSKHEQEKQRQEVAETYKKVSEFLEQNKNLTQSITSMNELSKELHTKKQNLMKMISNIKENMQEVNL